MSIRNVDWDGVITFGLTIVVALATFGGGFVVAAYRVVTVARMRVDNMQATELLIVPGKRLLADGPDDDYRRRLQRAAAVAQGKGRCRIVVLGGATAGSTISEAEAGENFLRSLPNGRRLRIMRESASRNTLTNLRNARDMLSDSLPCDGLVTLISNRYHLARLGLIAESLSVKYVLWPAEDALQLDLAMVARLLREALFYLWFSVGKRWAVLTGNGRMLARVT